MGSPPIQPSISEAKKRRIKCYAFPRMDDRPLAEEEPQQLRRNLSLPSKSGVENAYQQAYKRLCAQRRQTAAADRHSTTGAGLEATLAVEKEIGSAIVQFGFAIAAITLISCVVALYKLA